MIFFFKSIKCSHILLFICHFSHLQHFHSELALHFSTLWHFPFISIAVLRVQIRIEVISDLNYENRFLVKKRMGVMAGQCRTDPWPAVPDWSWWLNADAGLKKLTGGKNANAGLTFSEIPFTYDFSTSYSTNNTISSRLWTCRVYPFPLPSFWSVDVRGVLFYHAGMSDCSASYQSDTGMNKNANAGTRPVPG